jgi:TRAP-type C4-dicarboxylate transport system permease small subunit
MKWKRQAKRGLDWALDLTVGSIFAGMTVLIMLLVILRYVFNSSVPGGSEVLRYAFMYTTFLGAGLLVGRREHIAICQLMRRLPRTVQRGVDVFVHLLIIALHIYLMILSFRWIAVTGGNIAEELNFPLKYVQISLPIGCGLAALYALSNTIDALFDPNWGKREASE